MPGNVSGPAPHDIKKYNIPDRMIAVIPNMGKDTARQLATESRKLAQLRSPKLSGNSSKNLHAIWGDHWFGIQWMDPYVWWQENGVRAHTMWSLAGKTIPMWIDDPTGYERQRNPHARTRVTASGKTQVLIFRKAARPGQRKTIRKQIGGVWTNVSVPAAYPGAPGRIALRGPLGAILSPETNAHIGVRWRNPGLQPRQFIYNSMLDVISQHNLVRSLKAFGPTDRNPTA